MTAASPSDPHPALRDDGRLLGTLLGDTLRARAGDDLFLQIELLHRLRQSPDSQEVRRAFVVTVNGIAAPMRNPG